MYIESRFKMFKKKEGEKPVDEKNDLNKILLAKARNQKIKKIVKRVIIIAIVLWLYVSIKMASKNQLEEEIFNFDEVSAKYDELTVSVEGDGIITANSIYTITPKVTGEILQDYVVLNDYVKKGDLLYVIDSKDINNTINQASLGVEQSNVSIQQAQNNLKSIKDQINDLKIIATAEGYVENLRISEGNAVSNMMQVCDIAEKNAYEVVLQFKTSDANNIAIGNRASVFFLDFFTYLEGTVTKKSDNSSLKTDGAQATNVTVALTTTGYSIQNARVNGKVFTNSGAECVSVGEARVTSVSANVVTSNSTGVVKELKVENGSYVHKGDVIAILENSSLDTQLSNAESTVQNAEISAKNAQTALNSTRQQLDNYRITSPIDGKIVFKNMKKGDVISTYQQASSNVMAIVADVSTMRFEMQVDELDIPKIKIGQEVVVTVEALDNREFQGEVTNVNTIGVNAGGSTNYTILIEIPGCDEIYSGMTVDAKVKVAEKEKALVVPLTAVRKGDVVYKKVDDAEFQDEDSIVPKGYEKATVQLGLNNGEYIEILSGLTENDIVLIDKVTESGKFDLDSLSEMMRENN